MGNVRSIKEFKEGTYEDVWDVGVWTEAFLPKPDGWFMLHWASYAKVMDFVAVAFYAKKLFADFDRLAKDTYLTDEEKDAILTEDMGCIREGLDSIVFKTIDGESMTEEDADMMEKEYESILSNLIEEDE